ncbi:MAG TPA: hypothetical protein VJV79_12100 [Polyangiaceae bacterium]|nr:hypothetical protein [Polyangiaceae bacterium]
MLKERSLFASRWVSYNVLLVALPGALLGCGAPAAPVAPSASTPAGSVAPIAKEDAADLTPVPAPAELIAISRFKKPKTAIETVAAWANFPYKLHDVLPSDLKGLESVVAWDAPLEAAVALDPLGEGKVPEPLAVVSVGLTSLEGALDFARSKGQSVRRLRAGVYRIGESEDVSCSVGAAVGSAPARLVCGHREHDVDGLFNYATRGLPNEPLPNLDFQLELRLEPIKKKYQAELGSARLLAGFLLREVQVDNPRFDRALSDVAYSLIDEATALVHDLDRVRVDGALDSAKNLLDLRLGFKFAGQKSWLVQASSETLAMVEPTPDLFWQMPADSTQASFGVGWKPGRLKPIGHTLAELLDGYLESEKVPQGLRNQASKSVELLFEQNTKQVRAQGELSELPNDPLLAASYRLLGWQVAALEGDSKSLISLFDAVSATVGSRDLARLLKARLNLNAALLPKVSSHGVQLRGFKPGSKAYRFDISRELLEKYAKSQLKLEPAAKGKPPAKSVPLSVIVAFDGERTWIGACPDEQAMIKRLESLKDPKTPVLRTREGLEALRRTPHAAGGFLTLARFAGQLGALGSRAADAQKLFTALPHHGDTPVLFSYDLNSSGPEITTTLTVPRAAVEDLGALVPVLALMAGKRDSVLATP